MTTTMEQYANKMARVPAEIVDQWLEGVLESHDDWHEVVETGRSEDGSFEAHPDVIAELEEMTGIEAEYELVPILTGDEIGLSTCR